MEVVVDGSTGFVTPDDGATLKSVFESLRRSVAGKRRAVVSLTLDGEILSSDRESAIGGQKAGGYGLLEIKTANPFVFSLDTLSGLNTHLRNLELSHAEGMAFADSNEYTKALEKFEACFNGWDVLVRVVRDVGNLTGADFTAFQVSGRSIEDIFQALHETLLRFAAALDVKDVLRIGELAKVELKPCVDQWREVVSVLTQHVAKSSGAA